MAYERKYNWRAVIKQIDPEAERRIGEFVSHTLVRDSEIPRKYKELILMACSATLGLTVIQSRPRPSTHFDPLVSIAHMKPALCMASTSSLSNWRAGSPPVKTIHALFVLNQSLSIGTDAIAV